MAGVLDKYRKNTEGQNAAATSGGVYGTREVGGVLDKYKTPAKKEEEVTLTDPYGMWKLEQQMREQMQKAKAEREAKEAAARAATQNTVLAAQRAVEGAKQAQEAAAQRQREAQEAEARRQLEAKEAQAQKERKAQETAARKEWMGAQGEIFRAMQSGEYDTLEALAQDSAEKKAVYDEAKAVRYDAVNQKYAPERFDPFVQAAGATPLDKYDAALLEKGKTAQGNPLYQNPQQWLQGGGMAGANAAMERQQALAALTEEQKAYINYLYGTYDKKLAAELTETLLQNVRNAATLDKENAPAGQKVQNVLSAVGGGIFAAPQYVAEMAKNTAENIAHGTNLSVADYTPGARAMSEQAARTQAVVDSAETPVGKFLTETGLSVGQNAVNTLLFGRLAPAVMAVESAAQGGYGAAQNGATGGQQVAKAVQSAVTEYLTEKISWGKLDKLLNGMGAKTAKEAIAKIAAQMATEGGEELVSEAVGMLYDWIAMGDAGDLKQTMNAYRAENGTEGQAEHLALEILRRLGSAALAGGISGGVLGGGAQLLNAAQTPAVGAGRTARNAADLQPAITDDGQAGGETVQELVEMAKKSRDPQVQQLAQMVESGNARPAVVSALAEMLREDAEMNAQAGDLTQETAQQIPQAERLAQEKAEESEFGAAQSAMPQTEAGREAQQMEGMREYADEGGVFAADAEELAAGNAQGTVADFAQTAADQMPAEENTQNSGESAEKKPPVNWRARNIDAEEGAESLQSEEYQKMTEQEKKLGTVENIRRFAKRIKETIWGDQSYRKIVVVGNTPEMYSQFGSKSKVVTISPKTIEKIVFPEGYLGYDGKHNLGEDVLSQIPKIIEKPEAVLRSKTDPGGSIVLVSNIKDAHGDEIIVVLKLNAQGEVTLENRIASAYGKKNLQALYGENDENVLWTKENGSNPYTPDAGLQLPGAVSTNSSVNESVPQQTEKVNAENAENVPEQPQMPARPANKRSAERRARDAARELLAGKEGEERILQAFRQMDAATMTPEMRQVVAQNIAKELVKEGPYIRKDFWESFAPLREYLKKTQMHIDPQTLGEIKNMGFSVTKFNEKYGTKLTTKNGPGMRSLDGNLAEWAPLTNGIVQADAANAFDALVHTLEVMRQGKAGELDKQGLESAIDGTAEVLLKYADETMEPDELAALEKKGGEKPVLQSTAKEKPQGTGWERFGENRIAQAMQHKPEGTVANIGDAERVRHAEEEIAKARKRLQGLKDNAEKGEVSTAESIARGEMTLQDVSPRFSVEKVALMAEQLRLIRQWEEQGQSGQRRMLHTQEFEQAERMLEDADDAIFGVSQKESENTRRKRLVEAGKLLASTSERVMYKVFEPATAKRMIERYIRPAERNEAAKIMAISRLFDGARELGLNDYESTMTQLVGEGLIEAWSKAGENPQWTDGQKMIESLPEYARANPEIRRLAQHMDKVDADKVTKAVEWYRKTYADFHALVNDFRLSHGMAEIGTIENYFPHFSDSMDGDMLNRTLKAFGIEQMTNLPASISGRTAIFRPNSRWVGNFQRRTGPQTVFDANMGFQVYANAVMDMLYHTDDIMRIRHLETMVRERSDAQQQSGEREGTEERRERMREKLNDPEQMKRLEEQMEADVKAKDLAEEYSGFVIWLREYANKLANKGEGYGRMSETVAGRATANTLNKLLSNYSTAQIVGNVRSALANTAVLPKMIALLGTQSGASMFNAEVYVGQALRKMANGEMADVYGKSEFMTSKQGVDPLSRTRKEKSADRLMWFFNVVEDAMSKLAFTAKYVQAHDAMKQSGKSAQEIEREAIQQANDFAAQVMSRRDKAGASLLSRSRDPLIKLANMFQNEISNEYQTFVQDLPREAQQMAKELGKGKTAAVYGAALARYVLYSNVLAFFAESIFGINPFNDPLGWLTDLIENIWEEPEEEDEKGKVNWNAAGEFIGDVAGAIPHVSILAAAAGYTNDRLPLFNAKEFGEDLLSIATAERLSGKLEGVANVAGSAGQLLGVPFAGQAVKTIKGAIAVADAGKRSQKTGQLQDAWTWDGGEGLIDAARAVTFGPSAMKGVREYYETGKAELTSAQTEAYDAAIGADIPRDEALAYVKWSKDVTSDKDKDGKTVPNSKRVKYLERANDMPGLTGEQKAILYQGALNSEQAEEFARATEEIQELGFDMDTWLDFLEGYYRINGTGKKDRVKKLLATLGVTGAQARLMAKAAGYDIS